MATKETSFLGLTEPLADAIDDQQASLLSEPVETPNVNAGVAATTDAYEGAAGSILDTDVTTPEEVKYDTPTVGTVQKGSDFVTPESTVSYQLSELLKQDSPYMDTIRAASREQAEALGMLSSSMGIEAGEAAAIKGALPIAQADAAVYAGAQEAQQKAQYEAFTIGEEGKVSAELNKYKQELADQSKKLQYSWETAIKMADAESKAALQQSQNQWNFAIQDATARLESQLQDALNRRTFYENTAENIRTQSAELIKNNQISIENLLKDPDMLELGAEAMSKQVNNMINFTTANIQFLYDSAGLNVDGYISDLLADLETTVQW